MFRRAGWGLEDAEAASEAQRGMPLLCLRREFDRTQPVHVLDRLAKFDGLCARHEPRKRLT